MTADSILMCAADCYGFDQSACRLAATGRQEEKQLYLFQKNGSTFVLRIVECGEHELSQAKAEMDWLLYLSRLGAAVPRPLPALSGQLAVGAEEKGKYYHISASRMVQGRSWDKDDPNLWNPTVFYQWGKAVGQMHSLTKDYVPPSAGDRRREFDLRSMVGGSSEEYPMVDRTAKALLCKIEVLPKDRNSYGLIHNDLHPGNLLIGEDRVYLVDFDGCGYSWYTFDLANALYLGLWLGRHNSAKVDFSKEIIRSFLLGYRSACQLSEFWLSKVPLFMMCCKIALFRLGCDSETPGLALDAARQEAQARNIENNILFADFSPDAFLFGNSAREGGKSTDF